MSKPYQDSTFSTNESGGDPLEALARQGARQMLQAALEAEVDEYLQRPRYERGQAGKGYRNGYLPERTLTLGSGGVQVKVPRVSDEPESERFESKLVKPYQKRSQTVEAFAARGVAVCQTGNMNLKTIEFPSANFPGADLRVNSDTQYKFICASCSTPLITQFGWLLQSGYSPPILTPEQMEEVRSFFQTVANNSSAHFDFIKCSACGAAYIIHSQIEETSNGVYRVVILGAAQVEN